MCHKALPLFVLKLQDLLSTHTFPGFLRSRGLRKRDACSSVTTIKQFLGGNLQRQKDHICLFCSVFTQQENGQLIVGTTGKVIESTSTSNVVVVIIVINDHDHHHDQQHIELSQRAQAQCVSEVRGPETTRGHFYHLPSQPSSRGCLQRRIN